MNSTFSHNLPARFTPIVIETRTRLARRVRADRAALARAISGRRRLVDPTTCERDDSAEAHALLNAMQAYKKSSGRMFPTWSEVLEVLVSLGYQKVPIPLVIR
jgi:hypothetical protein